MTEHKCSGLEQEQEQEGKSENIDRRQDGLLYHSLWPPESPCNLFPSKVGVVFDYWVAGGGALTLGTI